MSYVFVVYPSINSATHSFEKECYEQGCLRWGKAKEAAKDISRQSRDNACVIITSVRSVPYF